MYDIEFFRKADKLKGKIVSGDLTMHAISDVENPWENLKFNPMVGT